MASPAGSAVSELKIGPFVGGMNRYSDISAIADDEMVDCQNFDLALDGSLQSRPPWRPLFLLPTDDNTLNVVAQSYQLILGSFTYNGVRMIFYFDDHGASSQTGAYIFILDGTMANQRLFIEFGRYSKAVRYENFVYIIPDVTNGNDSGLRVDISTVTTSLFYTSPLLARGYSALIFKDRLWITGRRGISPETRLFFSAPGDPTTFPSTNFFDINPGDGDATQDIIVYQDNLVIFKDSATYVLTFDSDPADAALQVINTDIGVSGPRCVMAYENSIFVLQYNQVYEMVNYDFTRVSVKVPFEYDPTLPDNTSGWAWQDPIWMSRIGDRLVVRFYNRLYVYHLRLRAWTRWDSTDISIKYIGYILLIDNTDTGLRLGHNSYAATSSLNGQYDSTNTPAMGISNWNRWTKFFILDDRYENTFTENGDSTNSPSPIQCKFVSKAYDIGLSHRFKRLMHWGVDTITGQAVTGTLFPFSVAYKVMWSQLHSYHWHDLQTWGYPLFAIPDTSQSIPISSGITRRYIRFPKSIRFRILQFQVDMIASGNTTDGPARIYSLTAFVSAKQIAPEAVN